MYLLSGGPEALNGAFGIKETTISGLPCDPLNALAVRICLTNEQWHRISVILYD